MWNQNISWNLIFLSLPYLHVVELTKIGSQKKKKRQNRQFTTYTNPCILGSWFLIYVLSLHSWPHVLTLLSHMCVL